MPRAGYQKVQLGYVAQPLTIGARNVAPTGGTVLATLTPPAGTYEVRLAWATGVGTAAVEDGNLRLDANGVVKFAGIPVGAEIVIPGLTLDGTNPLRLVVPVSATATVVYSATLVATRIA